MRVLSAPQDEGVRRCACYLFPHAGAAADLAATQCAVTCLLVHTLLQTCLDVGTDNDTML